MEVKVIIITTFLFICLSMFLSPSSATAMQIQKLPPVHAQGLAEMIISLPHQLPRKLRFLQEKQSSISGGGEGSTTSNKEKKEASSAGEATQRMAMHGSSKGRWEEWAEGSDTSHLFSMDYSHVKRRRPIHNKSLPVGP